MDSGAISLAHHVRTMIVLTIIAIVSSCANEDTPYIPDNEHENQDPSLKWTTLCSDRSLRSVWRDCASRSYAVGDNGMAYFSDGGEWIEMDTGTNADLKDVWGDNSGVLFAVGESGTILEYDGSWSVHSTGFTADLNSVWGFSPFDVYAAGESGTILHFDSTGWTAVDCGSLIDINDIWGRSGNDIYAAGTSTTFLHYNGVKWTRMPSPNIVGYTPTYYAVRSDSNGRVYLAGGLVDGTGTLYIMIGDGHDTRDWRCHNNISTGTLRDLFHVMDGFLYAVGDGGAVYSVSGTTTPRLLRSEERVSLEGVCGCGPADITTVGSPGMILKFEGGQWLEDARFTNAALYSIFGAGKHVFAAGEGGVLMHYDRETLDLDLSSASVDLFGLWGLRGDEMVATGMAGKTFIFDGTGWVDFGLPPVDNLHGIWGFIGTDIWGVGAYGRVYHFDGSAWSMDTDVCQEWLLGVWGPEPGDLFAVGRDGGIFRLVAGIWTTMHSGVDFRLCDVWGSSGENVFAVGKFGTILRYNGSMWTPMDTPTDVTLNGIWGFVADDIIAVGEYGTVIRYDGDSWKIEESGTDEHLFAVWGAFATDIFASGTGGTVIHYGPVEE